MVYTTQLPKIKIWEVTMKNEKDYSFKPIISLRISRKLLLKLDKKAKEEKKTRSYMINKILNNSID